MKLQWTLQICLLIELHFHGLLGFGDGDGIAGNLQPSRKNSGNSIGNGVPNLQLTGE